MANINITVTEISLETILHMCVCARGGVWVTIMTVKVTVTVNTGPVEEEEGIGEKVNERHGDEAK